MQNLAIAALCTMIIFIEIRTLECREGASSQNSPGKLMIESQPELRLSFAHSLQVSASGCQGAVRRSGCCGRAFVSILHAVLTGTQWVGITCYPHFGDEPAEVQGRQRTFLRSCSRYRVGGLGARFELGQYDLFLCQSMFIA